MFLLQTAFKRSLIISIVFIGNLFATAIESDPFGAFTNLDTKRMFFTKVGNVELKYTSSKIAIFVNKYVVKNLKVSELIIYSAPIDNKRILVVTTNKIYVYNLASMKIDNGIENHFLDKKFTYDEFVDLYKKIQSNSKYLKIGNDYYSLPNLKKITNSNNIGENFFTKSERTSYYVTHGLHGGSVKVFPKGNRNSIFKNIECIKIENSCNKKMSVNVNCNKISDFVELSPHQNQLEDFSGLIVWLMQEKGVFFKNKYLIKISAHTEKEYNKIKADDINIASGDDILISPKQQKLFVLNHAVRSDYDNLGGLIKSRHGNSIVVYNVKDNNNSMVEVFPLDSNYNEIVFLNASRTKFMLLNNAQEGLIIDYKGNKLEAVGKLFYDLNLHDYVIFTRQGYYFSLKKEILKNIKTINGASILKRNYQPKLVKKVLGW